MSTESSGRGRKELDEDPQLLNLIAAVRTAQQPTSLTQQLQAAGTVFAWVKGLVVTIVAFTFGAAAWFIRLETKIMSIDVNEASIREMKPKVDELWWMRVHKIPFNKPVEETTTPTP